MIEWGLDEAVSDLFAFSFVQFADSINLTDEFFVLFNVGFGVVDGVLIVGITLEHGELEHLVFDG